MTKGLIAAAFIIGGLGIVAATGVYEMQARRKPAPKLEAHQVSPGVVVDIVYLNDGTPCAVARGSGTLSITCSWRVPK